MLLSWLICRGKIFFPSPPSYFSPRECAPAKSKSRRRPERALSSLAFSLMPQRALLLGRKKYSWCKQSGAVCTENAQKSWVICQMRKFLPIWPRKQNGIQNISGVYLVDKFLQFYMVWGRKIGAKIRQWWRENIANLLEIERCIICIFWHARHEGNVKKYSTIS